jgi:hypothetical protein
MVIGLAGLGLVCAGCAQSGPSGSGDPDITYEVTGKGAGAVIVRYLKRTMPGERPGSFLGNDGHETTTAPFEVGVHLGSGWNHAVIEAKTDPVDTNVALHCVIRHNGAVVTEGDGAGGVVCRVYGGGTAPSVAPTDRHG